MSIEPLPERPSLDQLRRQAKDLRRAVASGDGDALTHADAHLPGAVAATFTLSQAQRVIARHYGAPTWNALRARIEAATSLGRFPDEAPPSDDVADEFLRLACLPYDGSDGADRWSVAAELLSRDPSLAARSIHAAAAAGDVASVQRFLASDAALVSASGGPFDWPPLLYVAYARTANPEAVAIVRALL